MTDRAVYLGWQERTQKGGFAVLRLSVSGKAMLVIRPAKLRQFEDKDARAIIAHELGHVRANHHLAVFDVVADEEMWEEAEDDTQEEADSYAEQCGFERAQPKFY